MSQERILVELQFINGTNSIVNFRIQILFLLPLHPKIVRIVTCELYKKFAEAQNDPFATTQS